MDLREEFIKEKKYSYFNNTVLNEYALWLEKKLTENSQALQLQQTGVVRSNLIDESPEPRINVHRFNESDYHDGKFLK
jgi:hypothetical protein